jgi:polyhydroxyalkanoate synthesis repressor PhaR
MSTVSDERTDPTTPGAPVVIKKYANRRLYNTDQSCYVTLDDLSSLVRAGIDFVVQDAKTGEDITRQVLAQIIFEQENRGQSALPPDFLRQVIRMYGDAMQPFLPAYLSASMDQFVKGQNQLREQMARTWGGGQGSLSLFEEQARQNMAMFEQAMRVFSPFAATAARRASAKPPEEARGTGAGSGEEDELHVLKRQIDVMQRQIEALAAKTGG